MSDTAQDNGEAREQLLVEARELRDSFRASRDLSSTELSYFRELLMEAVTSLTKIEIVATASCRSPDPAREAEVDLVPLSEIGSVVTALEDARTLDASQVATTRRVVDATKQRIDNLKLLEDDQEQ